MALRINKSFFDLKNACSVTFLHYSVSISKIFFSGLKPRQDFNKFTVALTVEHCNAICHNIKLRLERNVQAYGDVLTVYLCQTLHVVYCNANVFIENITL